VSTCAELTTTTTETSRIEISKSLEVKFSLLNKLIKILSTAKKSGELEQWIIKIKNDALILQLGCSEAVAESYIQAALKRI
jgi:hypothetical protein|tara:strand:+ start:57604 stop:57846 length:243 start_codon:yes stop_codon:yes gene_type:complete